MHSHDYTDAAPFKDMRVLVIGGGNSACDIAVETSRVSKTTELSIRHGGWYMPKLLFGLPTDVLYGKLQWMTTRLQKFFMELSIRMHVGSWSRYGLPAPRGRVYETISVYNTELLYFIRHGKIRVRGTIEKFDGKHVHFADGSVAEYDAIVAATGFKTKLPFFDASLINPENPNFNLYLQMIHPGYRNLFFIGLCQPSGCVWSAAELQSKVVARHLAGKLTLEIPAKLRGGFSLHLDYPSYRKRMVALLGKRFVSRDVSAVAKSAQQKEYELVEESV